jgi:hypothetical protein
MESTPVPAKQRKRMTLPALPYNVVVITVTVRGKVFIKYFILCNYPLALMNQDVRLPQI